jgi:hypothetical protein
MMFPGMTPEGIKRRAKFLILLIEGVNPNKARGLLKMSKGAMSRAMDSLTKNQVIEPMTPPGFTPSMYKPGPGFARWGPVLVELGLYEQIDPGTLPPGRTPPPPGPETPPGDPLTTPPAYSLENINYSYPLDGWTGPDCLDPSLKEVERPPSMLEGPDKAQRNISLIKGWGPSVPDWWEPDRPFTRGATSWGFFFILYVPELNERVNCTITAGPDRATARFTLPRRILGPQDPLKEREDYKTRRFAVIGLLCKITGARYDLTQLNNELAGEEVEHPIPPGLLAPGWKLETPDGSTYTDSTIPDDLKKFGPETVAFGTKGDVLNVIHLTLPQRIKDLETLDEREKKALLVIAERMTKNELDSMKILQSIETLRDALALVVGVPDDAKEIIKEKLKDGIKARGSHKKE